MAKKSIEKNYIYNTLYQVLSLLTPLVTAPYLSRVLGPEGIGQHSYIASVVSYFSLFALLGMGIYGQREIAARQNDRVQRSQVFWDVKILSILSSAVCLAAYVIFCFHQNHTALYLVFALNILNVAVDITWLYQGMEEFGQIVLRNTIVKFIDIAFIFLFVREKEDLFLYAAGTMIISVTANMSLWIGSGKYIDKPKWKNVNPFRILPTVLALFAPTVAIQVYTVLDKTMIGVITQSAAENGYYEQSLKLSKMLLTLVTSLGTVMIPRISYHFQKKDSDRIREYMYGSYRFVWFLGIPLCFGLIGVASSFVPWFYGPGYEKVVPLLQILSLLILAIGLSNVTGMQYLIPTNRQNVLTLTVVVGAVINFVLNMIIIRDFASVGAAIASVAAETAVTVVQLIAVRKELSLSQIMKSAANYLVAGGVMLGIVLLLNGLLADTIVNTAVLVIVGMAVYFGILVIRKDSFLLHILQKFKCKINKKS